MPCWSWRPITTVRPRRGSSVTSPRIAEATDRPIVLYSIPSRCGVEIGVPVVERLRARFPHVRYIKESGGSVDRVDQLKLALGRDLVVLSGDDALTLPFMAVGAEGIISVASNLLPREVVKLSHLALAGDYRRCGPAAPPPLSGVQGAVHRDESRARSRRQWPGPAASVRRRFVCRCVSSAPPNLAALKLALAAFAR